jgi:hypothetical protein
MITGQGEANDPRFFSTDSAAVKPTFPSGKVKS